MNKEKAVPKKKRQIVKTGDVVAIPLPDGRYAFGLKMGENLAIYSAISNNPSPPVGWRKFLFAIGVYADVISNTDWPKVGKDEITQGEVDFASWGYGKDVMSGKYDLYKPFITFDMIPASREECVGLERVAVYEKNHVEDRIVDTLNLIKSQWLEDDEWIPFGLDFTDMKNLRRVSIEEILA